MDAERTSAMPKLFADTSNIVELERLMELGIFSGITTNPILVAEQAGDAEPYKYYQQLAKRFPDVPISVQLLDDSVPVLVETAERYHAISPNIVVKVPMFGDGRGLGVLVELAKRSIPTNTTALMKTEQLLLALIAGSSEGRRGPNYVSLFFNRIKDSGGDPQREIASSRRIIDIIGFQSEIITGSIRRGQDVWEAIVAGTHIVTVPPKRIWEMIEHHKTAEFIDQSQKDWEKYLALQQEGTKK